MLFPNMVIHEAHVLQICSYVGLQGVSTHDSWCIRRVISQLKRGVTSQGLYMGSPPAVVRVRAPGGGSAPETPVVAVETVWGGQASQREP